MANGCVRRTHTTSIPRDGQLAFRSIVRYSSFTLLFAFNVSLNNSESRQLQSKRNVAIITDQQNRRQHGEGQETEIPEP